MEGRSTSQALVLGRPIENVDDADEVRALALIEHLEPVLRDWRAAEDLRQLIADNEQKSEALHDELGSLGRQATDARAELDALRTKDKQFFGLIAGLVIVTLILISLINFLLGSLVGAVSGLFLFKKFSQHKAAKDELASSLLATEQRLASLDTALKTLAGEISALVAELGLRSKGFPEIRLADVHFPLAAAQIGNSNLIIDLAGLHEDVTLHNVDVSELASGVRHIADRTKDLLTVPPMLSPSSSDSIAEDAIEDLLYGEEEELQSLVSDFTINLGRLKDSRLGLPLVKPESPVADRYLKLGSSPSQVIESMPIGGDNRAVSQIQSFVQAATQTRDKASAVFAELTDVYHRLEQACGAYAIARTRSMNTVHENLLQVLSRANWCSRRFYCPRTILSPVYIRELLGIDLDSAFQLSLDDLFQRLSRDPVVQQRLETNAVLATELQDAYDAVQEFLRNAESSGFEIEGISDESGLPRHIANQLRESKRHLRNTLQKVMTGSIYPILNFSSEAQLFYDPDTEVWSSPTSPYSYSTPDVVRFGNMVKAYTDVMMPLWDHLWTEKADFRKSEVFRTNESMIRMTEKESEKLIEIANQFRADMRTVRENVFTLESDLRSKRQEIISFRDGMSELGLLSEATLKNLSDEKIERTTEVAIDHSSADRLENVLAAIPQAQAELRGAVHDPIDMIKDPSALVEIRASLGARLVHNVSASNG